MTGFSREWREDEAAADYRPLPGDDYLELLSRYPIPHERRRLEALRNQRSTSPDGGNDGSGRCTLCGGPLLWGGTSYDPHTREHHARVRRRLLAAVALMLRSKVAGEKLW